MNIVLNNSVHDVHHTTNMPNRRAQENNRENEMDQKDEKHIRIKYLHAEADQIEVMMTVSGQTSKEVQQDATCRDRNYQNKAHK